MHIQKKNNKQEMRDIRQRIANSLLYFTQIFYHIRTGRTFDISFPPGRMSHYIQICEELESVFDGDCNRLIINVPPRYGKAIDINTPILTSEGWTVAGDIKEGDCIVGSEGFTNVTGVYPQGILNAKEVLFNDGQSIICNEEHLWNVQDRYTPTWKTFTTSYIENTIHESDGRKHWRIPLINGNFGNHQTFIDPYLFGCWLGDGHSHYAAITTMDEEIVKAFTDKGHELRLHTHQSAGKAKTYGIIGNHFSSTLRKNNLLKNKHIPSDCYLWSTENRLSLLQGLMDTDGTCGKNGQVSFTNTNKNIIEGAGYLVNSLGGTYRIYSRKCGTQTLNIRLPDNINPFRLQRKQQYVSNGIKCSPRRFIESIIDIEPTEMVCFTVDADDKLFAVGEGLILTHNTELLIHFVAWAMSQIPESNFLYISYAHSLAKKQTQTIRSIIQLPEYKDLFGVTLKDDTSAKDNFENNYSGSVYAAGAGGSITGRGAGVKGYDNFGGCIVIDDIHKPDEVNSDTVREGINEWYYNTLQSRINSSNTPIIFIGQRLHEDDLAARLINSGEFKTLIIPAIDVAGNPLHPEMHSLKALKKMQEDSPYIFASQYQQDPQPAGGGIFKPEWFVHHEFEPNILSTFITADSAETDKDYNDASVFSFWGIYKIFHGEIDTDMYALHWLDCEELRVEPKDLEHSFLSFYTRCMRHRVKPKIAAIEKKSTGVTLISVMKKYQGLKIIEIERTRASGSKTTRFLEAQPFVSAGHVSLPTYGHHTAMCIEHCRKITANDSHRFDDIADTMYDAIKLSLIDKTVINMIINKVDDKDLARKLMSKSNRVDKLRKSAYGS